MNRQKVILLDWDSTIADSSRRIVEMYLKRPFNKMYDLEWDFSPYIPKEDLEWALSQFASKEMYRGLSLINGCREALQELRDMGFYLIVCSKTAEELRPLKEEFIEELVGDLIDEIHLIDNFNKAQYCQENGIEVDFVVDDKIECHVGFPANVIHLLFGNYKWNTLGVEEIGGFREKYGKPFIELTSKPVVRVIEWKEVPRVVYTFL